MSASTFETLPPQHAFQGDAAHQAQRLTWLTPKDSPGTWYTRRDYRSSWALPPFHRTVFTAHTWISLPEGGALSLSSLSAPVATGLLMRPPGTGLSATSGMLAEPAPLQ